MRSTVWLDIIGKSANCKRLPLCLSQAFWLHMRRWSGACCRRWPPLLLAWCSRGLATTAEKILGKKHAALGDSAADTKAVTEHY
jgi:hypothetical protein